MPTHRALEDLPLILCGPILRRVRSDSVSVFIALKEPREVELVIRLGPDQTDGILHSSTREPTVALGEHLHVLVVTARIPGAGLEPGVVYGYDLRFHAPADGGMSISLAEVPAHSATGASLLEGDLALGYAPGKLPGFVLPAKALEAVHVLHGSCRKPHGEGSDLLAQVDDLIRVARNNAAERPQLLLLTGDQIYADDVSLAVLRSLHDTANLLLSWRETVPSPHYLPQVADQLANDDAWSHVVAESSAENPLEVVVELLDGIVEKFLDPFNAERASRISPPLRQTEIQASARLSSDAMDGHLLFLGEFYMMYLFCWSDVLWPREGGEITLPTYNEAVPAFSLTGELSKLAIDKQTALTLEFAKTLGKVRRALANVPTCMIFDDHEVTDDWNLNHDWVQKVNGSPMGPHLLRNALMAYAVFQDWGNQPEDYDTGDGRQILSAVKAPRNQQGEYGAPDFVADSALLLDLFNLRPDAADHPSQDRKTWHYTLNPYPNGGGCFQVIALDTRTWRGFPNQTAIDQAISDLKRRMGIELNPSQGLVLAPALLSDHAFTEQFAPLDTVGLLSIVISPAPVFGVPVVEDAVQRMYVTAENPEAGDNEAWGANQEALKKFVQRLGNCPSGVVLLSGDVHYAFSCEVRFPDDGGEKPNRIVQLCTSALKNQTLATNVIGRAGHRIPVLDCISLGDSAEEVLRILEQACNDKIDELGLRDGVDAEDLGQAWRHGRDEWWDGTPAFYDPLQQVLRLRGLNPVSLPDLVPKQLALLCAGMGAGYDILSARLDSRTYEHAQFTIHFLSETQSETERWAAAQALDQDDQQDPYAKDFALKQAKDIVGYNNLGAIGFQRGQGGTQVVHRLFWHGHSIRHVEQPFVLATRHLGVIFSEQN